MAVALNSIQPSQALTVPFWLTSGCVLCYLSQRCWLCLTSNCLHGRHCLGESACILMLVLLPLQRVGRCRQLSTCCLQTDCGGDVCD